ncbi:glycosyltransferase [Calothrix sp. NIES-3974]|uniref:glycosyltransferase n=1 Tax=Calothrix sp. NIES-3974 TaxID=2005462 RepID=UPI001E48997F|nr:glycosyltransferase [Calothrix sp. NIES-3974]
MASTQDNLPNSILEALACGTPCVAFDIGGISDMIEHKYNGYLAPAFETKELANGVNCVLEDNQRHQVLSENARKTVVTKFTQEQQAQAYTQLFADILQSVGGK